jgi:hypothetical protein
MLTSQQGTKGKRELPWSWKKFCGGTWTESGLGAEFGFFDVHVFEFTGFKDVPTLHAFDVFSVFIARNDLHARVLARFQVG